MHLLFWLEQNAERRVGVGSERQPGGAQGTEGFKSGRGSAGQQGGARGVATFFKVFLLFSLVLFFFHPPAGFISHAFIF